MHGFLNIDKPAGMTSHDVVARVRRIARQKRVGHAGTLDPAATGVLVVALGAATRLIEYVQDQTSKRYYAVVRLGVTTSTDDAEGEPLDERPVPPLDRPAIEAALGPFIGAIRQVPPMYSALHHEGRRLYDLARAGVTVDVPARTVVIERLDLLAWEPPLLTLDVTCGKGTYIRSLARDIGAALGCGGHLQALRRTAVGAFTLDTAVPLDRLAADADATPDQVAITRALLPADVAVASWTRIDLDAEASRRVRDGQRLELAASEQTTRIRAHGPDGALLALLERDGSTWKPTKVFDWS